jgi:hypothetical protein
MEHFFFIIGIWVWLNALLRSRDAVGLALCGVDALNSRDLKMQEFGSSCKAESGQAFLMPTGKLSARSGSRMHSVSLHKSLSAFSLAKCIRDALRKHFVRDQ